MNQKPITAIIIDDDPKAIILLEAYLRYFPEIDVVAKETLAEKGLEQVKEILPEIVFLDVDMPDINGLQVASTIHSELPYCEIVFTTAYQAYAFDALSFEPLDFLTKPFTIDDLVLVIQKYKQKAESKKQELTIGNYINSREKSSTIKLPTARGVFVAEINNIVLIKSNGYSSLVNLLDGSVEKVTENLNVTIKLLNSPLFFRINRSTFINMNYLQRIDKKLQKCILKVNQTIIEEPMTRHQILYFEKLDAMSFLQDRN